MLKKITIITLFLNLFRKNHCCHDYILTAEHPYMTLYGYGELQCKKCNKKKIIWSDFELIIWKSKIDS